MKVAICYWGLTRTLKLTYSSHEKFLYNKLRENNIDFDIYLHSWIHPTTNIDDIKSLNLKQFQVDDQTDFIKYIDENFSKYWYEHIYRANGGDSLFEWRPEMVKTCMYGIESQKRVTQLCIDSQIKYDFIIYLRPDILLLNEYPCHLLNNMDNDSIIVLIGHWGCNQVFGINDTFATVPFSKCKNYAFRIDEAIEYRKNVGRLAAEHYMGWIVKSYFKHIYFYDLKVTLKRL